MPKVRVTRDVTVKANDVANVFYAAREEPYPNVPSAHVDVIVASGAGERVEEVPTASAAATGGEKAAR